MEDLKKDKIKAFDTLFTEPHIQMLKILFPYVPVRYQKYLALYIKYSELQYTLKLFQNYPAYTPYKITSHMDENMESTYKEFNLSDFILSYGNEICCEIKPLCTESELEKINSISNIISTINTYKGMMDMYNSMKDLFPEGMDLSGMDLNGVDLNGMDLNGVDFSGMNLESMMQIINMFRST